MAGAASSPTDNPLLRGAFGSLQASAAAGEDTATIWSGLRQTVGSWQLAAQGAEQPFDPLVAEQTGRAILSAQGIDGAAVSRFRGVAGQWLGAKQTLQAQGLDEQITAPSIFTPPWASTNNPATPSRYRIRTQWQFETASGDIFNRWTASELTEPLTTKGDALAQAFPDPDTQSGRQILSGASDPILLDYEIEQI